MYLSHAVCVGQRSPPQLETGHLVNEVKHHKKCLQHHINKEALGLLDNT